MSEVKFWVSGDSVRLGDYVYSKSNLERKPAANCVGLSRFNRCTDKWEMYNPHTDGPVANQSTRQRFGNDE